MCPAVLLVVVVCCSMSCSSAKHPEVRPPNPDPEQQAKRRLDPVRSDASTAWSNVVDEAEQALGRGLQPVFVTENLSIPLLFTGRTKRWLDYSRLANVSTSVELQNAENAPIVSLGLRSGLFEFGYQPCGEEMLKSWLQHYLDHADHPAVIMALHADERLVQVLPVLDFLSTRTVPPSIFFIVNSDK